MKILYFCMIWIGVALASYGFGGVIDNRVSRQTLRSLLLLIGVLCIGFGLLMYHVPGFFSTSVPTVP